SRRPGTGLSRRAGGSRGPHRAAGSPSSGLLVRLVVVVGSGLDHVARGGVHFLEGVPAPYGQTAARRAAHLDKLPAAVVVALANDGIRAEVKSHRQDSSSNWKVSAHRH